jgi:hypothetical protein
MSPRLAVLAGGLLLMATPALAQAPAATCTRPSPPAAIDGATASMDQLAAYRGLVVAFLGASDTYQACMVDDLAAQRAAAKAAKAKFDESVAKANSKQIDANQTDKEAVGGAYNTAKKAYTAAHPS